MTFLDYFCKFCVVCHTWPPTSALLALWSDNVLTVSLRTWRGEKEKEEEEEERRKKKNPLSPSLCKLAQCQGTPSLLSQALCNSA